MLTFCYFATSVSCEDDANRGVWSIFYGSCQSKAFEHKSLQSCNDGNFVYTNRDNPAYIQRMSQEQIRAYLHIMQEHYEQLHKKLVFAASSKLRNMAHVKDRAVQNMTSRLMQWCASRQHVCELVLPPVIAVMMHAMRRSNRCADNTLLDGDAKKQ